MAGEIKAKPYIFGDKSGCDYCPFGSVCGKKGQGDSLCVMEDMKDEEVWEVLHERD